MPIKYYACSSRKQSVSIRTCTALYRCAWCHNFCAACTILAADASRNYGKQVTITSNAMEETIFFGEHFLQLKVNDGTKEASGPVVFKIQLRVEGELARKGRCD